MDDNDLADPQSRVLKQVKAEGNVFLLFQLAKGAF